MVWKVVDTYSNQWYPIVLLILPSWKNWGFIELQIWKDLRYADY